MIAIIVTCDKTKQTIDLTEEYWVTSLKQAYYMLLNNEIDNWTVKKENNWDFKHYYKHNDKR